MTATSRRPARAKPRRESAGQGRVRGEPQRHRAPVSVRRRRWRLALRALTFVFFALVLALIATRARSIEWAQVGAALRGYGAVPLVTAVLFAAASYLVYSGYELLARQYTGHRLPAPRVLAIALVSYAFNLNLGPWIGGIGFRYRLYSRHGLGVGTITRILGFAVATNWLGYLVLAGAVFALGLLPLPEAIAIGDSALRALGIVLLVAAASYLALCRFARRRVWTLHHTHVQLPQGRVAFAQLALSASNWTLVAAVLFTLLGGDVAYGTVLGVLLISSVAAVLVHIPAGLGVVEAVFLTFLSGQIPEGRLLAALLTYRAVYYLLPLSLALGGYALLEARARKSRTGAAASRS